MAKTLKDFLEGYLKVKSADEQKFIDKHVTAKNPDRNGNGDDVFKGSTKTIDRRKERKGYNPGEDEKVYEALKGGQKKLDKNKNGKLDSQDFKMLRKEDAEQIDELSTKTLDSYRSKSRSQIIAARNKDTDTTEKRLKGYTKASQNIQKNFVKGVDEEVDQISELSHATLRSYRMKSKSIADNEGGKDRMKGRELASRKSYGGRVLGVEKAKVSATEDFELDEVETPENVEQIDELSTSTLQSYRKKARAQGNSIVDKMKMGGGDWSKDQKDTKTLRKRAAGAQASGKKLIKRGESLKTEEVEQIEEAGYSAKAAAAGKDIGKPGKNFSKIANAAAKKYGSKAAGGRVAGAVLAKLRKEEKLAELISDLSESHQRTMTNVFEKLNEDNKTKFLEACDTPDGVEKMLDFAINHRGE